MSKLIGLWLVTVAPAVILPIWIGYHVLNKGPKDATTMCVR